MVKGGGPKCPQPWTSNSFASASGSACLKGVRILWQRPSCARGISEAAASEASLDFASVLLSMTVAAPASHAKHSRSGCRRALGSSCANITGFECAQEIRILSALSSNYPSGPRLPHLAASSGSRHTDFKNRRFRFDPLIRLSSNSAVFPIWHVIKDQNSTSDVRLCSLMSPPRRAQAALAHARTMEISAALAAIEDVALRAEFEDLFSRLEACERAAAAKTDLVGQALALALRRRSASTRRRKGKTTRFPPPPVLFSLFLSFCEMSCVSSVTSRANSDRDIFPKPRARSQTSTRKFLYAVQPAAFFSRQALRRPSSGCCCGSAAHRLWRT